jgi:VanZ family protein
MANVHSSQPSRWLWLPWLAVLALWTVGLVIPDPGGGSDSAWRLSRYFLVSKGMHLGVYALLAAGAAFLPGRGYWLLGLLALHAALTEVAQTFVPARSGSIRDVLINLLGLLIGFCLTWRRWGGKNAAPPQ